MRGHQHLGDPSLTQNQGNLLGDRPCVRQSKLYREHVGGNVMKELMGQGELKWDTSQTQGVYAGGRAFDFNNNNNNNNNNVNNNNNNNNNKQVQQVQVQQQQGEGGSSDVVISMDAGEDNNNNNNNNNNSSETQVQQQTNINTNNQQTNNNNNNNINNQQQQSGASPVASRAFRPGAGYANRQTYNIFTGE